MLGPTIIEPGDLCCVFFGASVPILLRRTETEGTYRVVGEAYFHGAMKGESKTLLDRSELREEAINLC